MAIFCSFIILVLRIANCLQVHDTQHGTLIDSMHVLSQLALKIELPVVL